MLPNPEELTVDVGKLFNAYEDERKSGNLLLKIQVSRLAPFMTVLDPNMTCPPDRDGPLMAYNQSKSFWCKIEPRKLDAQDLISIIERKGIAKTKGYFWAFMEEGKPEITIITDPIHPAQLW